MIEIDGPQKAFITDINGTRHPYVVYALACRSEKECLDAYYNWYSTLLDIKYIVWRRRPQVDVQPDSVGELYRISWRCCLIVDINPSILPRIKDEGEPVYILE